jgi:3-hydroxyisobutyrate dehydrogenase-like beta-hydroxyacid dehydrogenase
MTDTVTPLHPVALGAASCVGMAGMGIMGSILARRLLADGHDVIVFNRSPERLAPLRALGAGVADSPRALARDCDVIFTVLTGPEALSDVLFGEHGVATAPHVEDGRRIVCDLSTQDPSRLCEISARAAECGICLVEAPMAGSVHDATHGTLAFLFGGDESVLRLLAPYFAAWGPAPAHFGAVGQAATAKLALNLLVGLMAKGLAEALHLLQNSRIPVDLFLDVLASSGLRSPLYERLGARYLHGDTAVRFSLANLRKDIAFCEAHPAWGQHDPVLAGALHAMLERIPEQRMHQDYSSLLQLEPELGCAGPSRLHGS